MLFYRKPAAVPLEDQSANLSLVNGVITDTDVQSHFNRLIIYLTVQTTDVVSHFVIDPSLFSCRNEDRASAVIEELLKSFNVNALSALRGRIVRVLRADNRIWAIGHYLEDEWFGIARNVCVGSTFRRVNIRLNTGERLMITSDAGVHYAVGRVWHPHYRNAKLDMMSLEPQKHGVPDVVLRFTNVNRNQHYVAPANDERQVVRLRCTSPDALQNLSRQLDSVLQDQHGEAGRWVRLIDPFTAQPSGEPIPVSIAHPVFERVVSLADYQGTVS